MLVFMKTLMVALALALLARACGGEADPVSPTAAAPPAAPTATLAVNAVHGGSVILVEDQYIEVVPKSDGAIEAYVLAPAVPTAAPPLTPSNVSVKITGDDAAEHDVALVWSPATARFEGRLVDARPVPGPIEVTLIAPGRPPRRARAPQVIVVTAAPPPASAAPVVVVQPHVAPVVVTPPAPTVVVTPTARPGVVVVAPPAPGVIVVDDHPGRGHGRRHGAVVVGAPAPPAVIVAPSRPRGVVVAPGPGPVVITPGRGHGHRRHGGGRRRDD
jgi:hypothetical protein